MSTRSSGLASVRSFQSLPVFRWFVVSACFAASALSAPGQSYALGLYFETIGRDLDVGPVTLASAYGGATIAAALLLPVFGRIADRTNARWLLATLMTLIGASLVALAFATNLAVVAIALFGLRLLGQGAIGVATMTTVMRWFDAQRGRAMAITAVGYACGELLAPPLILRLQATFGWRHSLVALALPYVFVAAPLFVLLLQDPKRRDVHIGGARGGAGGSACAAAARGTERRAPLFWAMVALATIVPVLLTGIFLHQPAVFRSVGWEPSELIVVLPSYAVANVLATLLGGVVLERMHPGRGFTLGLGLFTIALGIPLVAPHVQGASVVYGLFLGAGAGAISATNGVAWTEYFGVTAIGALKGVVSAVRNAATAGGAVGVALLAGGDGEYRRAIAAGAAVALVGTALSLLLPRPRSAAPSHEDPRGA